ncbi:MAG: Stealth CR1 domain-containing protein [Victivallales bacterium]|nr:Stealth CR1 domain-containing protein [Victivallales bacterium]
MEKIDFVLTWVDGTDKEWLEQKRKYENSGKDIPRTDVDANAACRYRDYGLLQYWFRAIEQFTPWVDRIFFVTCGQKPEWLNESHPKLRLINHKDYIPADYLPTFQSNTIELNLHRLPDLSEHFVLFNDDMFVLRPISPEFFFRKGLPVLPCDFGIPRWLGYSNPSRVVLNNSGALKLTLDVEQQVWKHIWKYIDIRAVGLARAVKNLVSFSVNRIVIPGTFGHMGLPHLKSTFEELWRAQPEILERTSSSRFRTDECVNHWLACAWNMISGQFFPTNEKHIGELIQLNEKSLPHACDVITRQLYPQVCLNDDGSIGDVEVCSMKVAKAFEEHLPNKSSFEK